MVVRYLFPAIGFFVLAVIQLNIVPYIAIGTVRPDLILILLIYLTLKNGQIYGSIIGFVFGFFFDLFSGGMLGASMFSKTAAGFLCGYFYNENKIDYSTSSISFVFIVLITASLDSFLNSILPLKDFNITALDLIFNSGILPGFYTALVSFPVILIKSGRKLHD
ncbi:MAG: rod shape-determining protein MreD [bacterium]